VPYYLSIAGMCSPILASGEGVGSNDSKKAWSSLIVSCLIPHSVGCKQRGLNANKPRIVFFLSPIQYTKPKPMQPEPAIQVLVKSREMTGRPKHCRGVGGEGGKTTQNALAPFGVSPQNHGKQFNRAF
jgi:hypothetical protein